MNTKSLTENDTVLVLINCFLTKVKMIDIWLKILKVQPMQKGTICCSDSGKSHLFLLGLKFLHLKNTARNTKNLYSLLLLRKRKSVT